MIKCSIITPCLNSDKTLVYSLNSVLTQTYENIEHLIIDGESDDKTIEIIKNYPHKNKKFFSIKSNIYEALNLGIKKATGNIIGILNSDDIFENPFVIKKVIDHFILKNSSLVYGNTNFFRENFLNITRSYKINNFKKEMLIHGIMPPHTASFIKREVFNKVGLYNTNYRIAGDYDFFLRATYTNNIKFDYLDLNITRMRTGGVSGKNIHSYFVSTREIAKSQKKLNLFKNYFLILLRFPIKLGQFLFINKKKINNNFSYIYHKDYYKFNIPDFKIIKNLKEFNFKKNFIFSAMNLAYLGFYSEIKFSYNKNLYHWPDGIFIGKIIKKIKKLPGRKLFKILKNFKFKEVIILGNAHPQSIYYCKKIFKTKITHINAPIAETQVIINYFHNLKISKNSLLLITLPTPKQEQLAFEISKYNKFYKIICIGGSLAIASGVEKQVPKFFFNYEFLWRLRYDFYRRIKRLIRSYLYYIYGRYLTKKLTNLKIEVE